MPKNQPGKIIQITKSPDELQQLRQRIDSLDKAIISLIIQRLMVVTDVFKYKMRHGMPILDQSREQQLFAKVRDWCKQLECPFVTEVLLVFHAITEASRCYQNKLGGSTSQTSNVGRILHCLGCGFNTTAIADADDPSVGVCTRCKEPLIAPPSKHH